MFLVYQIYYSFYFKKYKYDIFDFKCLLYIVFFIKIIFKHYIIFH
jgi:hypothetical protein